MKVWAVRYVPDTYDDYNQDTWVADFADEVDANEFCEAMNRRFTSDSYTEAFYLVEEAERAS